MSTLCMVLNLEASNNQSYIHNNKREGQKKGKEEVERKGVKRATTNKVETIVK